MFHAAPESLLLLLLEPGVHRQMTRAVNVLLRVGAAAKDLRVVLVLGLGPALAKAILEKCASLHSRACVSLYISNHEFCSITGELPTGWLGESPLSVLLGSLPFPSGQHGAAFYILILGADSNVCCSRLCYPAAERSSRRPGGGVHGAAPSGLSPRLGALPLLPPRVWAQNSPAGGWGAPARSAGDSRALLSWPLPLTSNTKLFRQRNACFDLL